MKILPPVTSPPDRRIDRKHRPEPAAGRLGYRVYRTCLRWEFGFTCAFCLLHEADLTPLGSEGLGLMTIEHFVPASVDADRVSEYENCYYACRLCNQARANAPCRDRLGRRLLSPCSHVWSEHFRVEAPDRLVPVEGDGDAAYTAQVYDLNDPRKVNFRNFRYARVQECLAVLEGVPEEIWTLLEHCAVESPERSAVLLRLAQRMRSVILRAFLDLQRFVAIPRDADAHCRCGHRSHHAPPAALAEQALEIRHPIRLSAV
jgi:5-methylcytosine-specific restriction endonuclease McrA